jgi:hypothetical protein
MVQLRVVTRGEAANRLADWCEDAASRETLVCLKNGFEIVYGVRTKDSSEWRVFDQHVAALAMHEIALLLIHPLHGVPMFQRLEWNNAGEATAMISLKRSPNCSPEVFTGRDCATKALAICAAAMRLYGYLLDKNEI